MAVPTTIKGIDPHTGNEIASSVLVRQLHAGAVVYTEPLHPTSITQKLALNPLYGISLAQNAGFGGTPVLVHDGIDTTAWTGSNITGSAVTFDDTTRASDGSASVYVDNPAVGNTWEFDKGSDQDLSGYSAITMMINVDRRWDENDVVTFYGWDTGTGLIVGNTINLEDYFAEGEFDVWHSVIIPLADMGLEGQTVDAFRMQMSEADGGGRPEFWIDEFQLEETGESIIFSIEPGVGKMYFIEQIKFALAGPLDISVTNGTAPGLSHDKLLSLTSLSNGIVIRAIVDEEVAFQATASDIGDLLQVGAELADVICDGTNTMVTMLTDNVRHPFVLRHRSGDRFEIIVQDDLSSLLRFTVSAKGYELDDHAVRKHSEEDT